MPEGKYRSISLSKELIETIEDLIKENPQASYKSIADFVADAVRIRFEQLGIYPGNISLLDINANELGPLLYDKNLKKTVQIPHHPQRTRMRRMQTKQLPPHQIRHSKPQNPKTHPRKEKRRLETPQHLADLRSARAWSSSWLSSSVFYLVGRGKVSFKPTCSLNCLSRRMAACARLED